MTENKLAGYLAAAMRELLEETFENAHGIYLDRGTSLFETLATITAQEASRPVSANCASIAVHVAHLSFYIETLIRFVQGERPQVDWTEIWRTVREVTPQEWEASQQRLRDAYQAIRTLVNETIWEDEDQIGGALGVLMHNAYHLGEIRQALCTIKPDR
ncbi:MAG: DinB family protein [Chloroflexi bacterium]|nr:DinB family protein [Chloroflexota bacterium]